MTIELWNMTAHPVVAGGVAPSGIGSKAIIEQYNIIIDIK
jgi:hypothetical protein